ncbi:hypothetical protein J5N97_007435 [Dioscorea zingiberensis]|uniref:Transmembrane protein n=1 Tax=Dioscorea zingiberensis TaxID=325984 RepID=A0A9D5DD72_9LILI|nr:hypothetical protein J5N97_007435 [Dioscorea zingiberensis]
MASLPQPQPLVVYPHSISSQANAPDSNGSFGPVFIVLSVIAVVATLACIIGRLCARRFCKPKPTHVEDDLEYAFEINFPARKPAVVAAGHGGHKGGKAMHVGMREAASMNAEAGWKKGRPIPPVIPSAKASFVTEF